MIGNAIWLTGGGATAGAYFITAVADAQNITIDRSPGTITNGTGRVGGGWADFWTNTISTASAWIVGGQTIYILGGASPSYGSPDYSNTAARVQVAIGNGKQINYIADPNTPANNGFGGRPVVKTTTAMLFSGTNGSVLLSGIHTFAGAAAAGKCMYETDAGTWTFYNCVFDQDGWDMSANNGGNGGSGTCRFILCEVLSGRSARTTTAQAGINADHFGGRVILCNIHDCIGDGIREQIVTGSGSSAGNYLFHVTHSIISKNGGYGINVPTFVTGTGKPLMRTFIHNTFDANAKSGIYFDLSTDVINTTICNNIFTNHTAGGAYGIQLTGGTAASNEACRLFVDYNYFDNNTNGDYSGLGIGAHDVTGSGNPYVDASTENYTLSAPIYGYRPTFSQHTTAQTTTVRSYVSVGAVQPGPAKGTALPGIAFLQTKSGQTTTVRSYMSPGAVQPDPSGVGPVTPDTIGWPLQGTF